MKEQILSITTKEKFHNYFAAPVLAGLYGYAMFFTVLLASKGLGVLNGTIPQFKIDMDDVAMSALGFVFLFLIRFLKNYSQKE